MLNRFGKGSPQVEITMMHVNSVYNMKKLRQTCCSSVSNRRIRHNGSYTRKLFGIAVK